MCVECLVLRKESVIASKEGVGESKGVRGRFGVGSSLFSCCIVVELCGENEQSACSMRSVCCLLHSDCCLLLAGCWL